MPIIPYCMTEAEADITPPASGVCDAAVQSLSEHALRCFYSQVEELASNVRDYALQFHAVNQHILAQTDLIPFRFPTLLPSEAELRDFLGAHAGEYLALLNRLRGLLQMEVHIVPVSSSRQQQPSGREYLQARQAAARALTGHAARVLAAAEDLIRQWQVGNTAEGLRCYALVGRDGITDFAARVHSLSPSEGVRMRVSGPWPPMEFLHAGS